MTAVTKSTINKTDNKTVFAPLVKYAIIAVLMVSIIVTTTVMLDKQLNSAEHQVVATIEEEVNELKTNEPEMANDNEASTAITLETAEKVQQDIAKMVKTETTIDAPALTETATLEKAVNTDIETTKLEAVSASTQNISQQNIPAVTETAVSTDMAITKQEAVPASSQNIAQQNNPALTETETTETAVSTDMDATKQEAESMSTQNASQQNISAVTEIAVSTDMDITKQEAVPASTQTIAQENAVAVITTTTETTGLATPSVNTNSDLDSEEQEHTEALKAEKKQRMTTIYARINALEIQRLDEYKKRQDKQIERLAGQLPRPQQMIDALISRNKELLELRAATVKRNQSNREQRLNRI